MSRYRLCPSPAQERVMREHCAHARFVWNLAVEQQSWWRRGRKGAPGYLEQCRQLTAARRENDWLRAGSQTVQQQALRDFDQAMRRFFAGTHRRPTWRKASLHNGFRVVAVEPAHVRRLNRRAGEVWVPKAGWVRFRWSRAMPGARSCRVTLDRPGCWHVALAVVPAPVAGPGTGDIAGVDRGAAVSAALSTGETLSVPHLSPGRQRRLVLLQRKLARAARGSGRRARVKTGAARLKARDAAIRKDWAEKPGRNVRQKAGLNREIARSGWGLLVTRLEQKAPGRVEKVNPAYTSQRCSACGHVDRESRESQANFRCTACGFACNADVNAAKNIAAGHAVNARGGDRVTGPVKREPQHNGLLVA